LVSLWISVKDSIRQTVAIYVNQHRVFAVFVRWAVFPRRLAKTANTLCWLTSMATVYLIESSTEIQRLTSKGCLSILIQAFAIVYLSQNHYLY
jgi:predicted metal-binding membrane protein